MNTTAGAQRYPLTTVWSRPTETEPASVIGYVGRDPKRPHRWIAYEHGRPGAPLVPIEGIDETSRGRAVEALQAFHAEPVVCQWFALCGNEATTTRSHPILGDVPICDRCNAKVEALG